MPIETKTINAGLDVSIRVELLDIRIIKSTFEQTPDVGRGRKKVDISRNVNLEIDKEKELLFVIVEFTLNASIEGVESPVIIITGSFLLIYKLKDFDGLTDESYRSFAEVNAVFNVWPYWREYVQSVTVRMGLPSLTIPVFRISKSSDKETNKDTISKKVKSKAVTKKNVEKTKV